MFDLKLNFNLQQPSISIVISSASAYPSAFISVVIMPLVEVIKKRLI